MVRRSLRLLPTVALFAPILAGFALLFLASGCSDEEAPRSLVRVISANENRPLHSDVQTRNPDQTTTILEDTIVLEISNTPSGSVLQPRPDGPFGFVTLDRYVIRFDATQVVPEVTGTLGWVVHTGETIQGEIVIVPALHKTLPPLVGLVAGGEIVSSARISIYGRETTSNESIHIEATLPVHFANWIEN